MLDWLQFHSKFDKLHVHVNLNRGWRTPGRRNIELHTLLELSWYLTQAKLIYLVYEWLNRKYLPWHDYKTLFREDTDDIIPLTHNELYASPFRSYLHDDVIKWKHLARYWHFGRGIHRSSWPSQRPVTQSFSVFFHLRLNKWLSKQSRGWWFETPSCPLWRHCNVTAGMVAT